MRRQVRRHDASGFGGEEWWDAEIQRCTHYRENSPVDQMKLATKSSRSPVVNLNQADPRVDSNRNLDRYLHAENASRFFDFTFQFCIFALQLFQLSQNDVEVVGGFQPKIAGAELDRASFFVLGQ
ncbi:hypothetical protein Poly59_35550 [Rubripirellula reticaptiva]|uniref:Uncharacterized protein n=1 Tax=Rubripirellula reticaptiva TaxID=2528013 RepID=A0A5C6ESI2_9BACT|nr:hypothetical protein Poly59_35550 [Rubripirellula reticaptiva]